MKKRLILPAEVKVCATCSYWDGERQVDEEFQVVVVGDAATGECLVKESERPGLYDIRCESDCVWEHLDADSPSEDDALADDAADLDGKRQAKA